MAGFMIRFLLCNLFISAVILVLLIARRIFKNTLTSRMQYQLWFLLLGLLVVPFLPFRPFRLFSLFSWLKGFHIPVIPDNAATATEINTINPVADNNWINDFTLSVNKEVSSIIGLILFGIWIVGILAMITRVTRSLARLRSLKQSALPLQNKKIQLLFRSCLNEMNIRRSIPVYSTAFLKSPIIVGLWKPCIYLPLHLISDFQTKDMRYMLLHELQHYRHKDAVANHFMNLAGIVYWFNPFVWYALKEMRNDREIACDTAVLQMLREEHYEDYGNTLINFAEKISLFPFPFASGLSGNMKQLKRRILNIASYEKPTRRKKIQSVTAFGITAAILVLFVPFVSTYAAAPDRYQWNTSSQRIAYTDFSSCFGAYDGSFVLYDMAEDSWDIYNGEKAAIRVSPDSTYKIYNALFGLESGIITPENSFMEWNRENYPFEAWNADQTLQSAMKSSVNWYFERIDQGLGATAVRSYLQKIKYGNESVYGDFSSYWMQSSLKISPIEQVALLKKLYHNGFDFAPAHIDAVKNSIHLFTSDSRELYGKTGTGCVNGQDINGWFVGFVETQNNTYFFAVNIQNEQNATGGKASEIALSVLSDMNIWK